MGKCYFNADWLSDERFSGWVLPDNNDKSKFVCKICNRSYVVGYSGVKALTHHGDSAKHREMQRLFSSNRSLNFITPRGKTTIATPANQSDRSRSNSTSTSTCSSSSTPIKIDSGSNDQQPKLTPHTSTNDTLEAEIRWALYLISHHNSARDSDDIGSLFEVMFKDSQIAKTFRCSRSKLGYLVTFGIAPAVKFDILQEIKSANDYVLMFDESMNSDLQKKQLDIHIRYIGYDNLVKTKYIDSVFLEYAKARDIQRSLESTLAELGSVKLVQLAMDGPNVNWRVFKDLGKDIEMEKNVTLLNIGSCGLHVVHNSFKAGIVASEWDIASLLRSLYNLFNDAPTRKADFLKLGSTKSPLKFCGHRWLENVDVAERAIEIWPHIVKYIEEVKKGNLSNPSCASFKTVAEFEKDPLAVAKLHSFLFIAKILKPFLTKFQGSEPLAPFLCSDLFGIVKRLYGLILKPSFFSQLKEYSDLVSPTDIDKSNFKIHTSIDCGFQASELLVTEKSKKNVTDLKILEFKMSFQKFVKACISKILEKSPLHFQFAQDITCLSPKVMQEETIDSTALFRRVMSHLVSCKRVDADIVDDSIHQYDQLKSAIKQIPYSNERLDVFFNEHGKLEECPQLKRAIQIVLVLSHGNADVERGFSVNREVTVENLMEESLIARRLTCQFVIVSGQKVAKIFISPEMMKSCSQAWQRYSQALKEKSKSKEIMQEEATRKRKMEEITELNSKKKRLQMDINNLIRTADDLSEQAEVSSKAQHDLLIRSNALRRDSKARSKELDAFTSQLCQKEKALE